MYFQQGLALPWSWLEAQKTTYFVNQLKLKWNPLSYNLFFLRMNSALTYHVSLMDFTSDENLACTIFNGHQKINKPYTIMKKTQEN